MDSSNTFDDYEVFICKALQVQTLLVHVTQHIEHINKNVRKAFVALR